MDWKECEKGMLAKKISPDLELVASLLKASERKFQSANLLPLNETTAESVFILHYDSVREILEALAIKHGFKIYNHECYAAFLGNVLNKKEMAENFNALRRMRNAVNYYGQIILLNEVKQLITELIQLRSKIKKLF